MAYEAESEFCMAALNLLREKYQGQIETKFLASNQYSLGQKILKILLNV